MRAAAAHKVKDFCLALDKSVQEQVKTTFVEIFSIILYCNFVYIQGDHDPPSAVREGAGDRRQSACEVCSCLGEFIFLYWFGLDTNFTSCYDSGDHGSESNPRENKHN